jgi:phosphoribosylformimino-5-aminoimidazole carboxamide ribotide isomerase
MNGSCVRLQQGDASRKTEYNVPPEMVAHGYQVNGARRIHVVDLDGAFEGTPRNLEAIKKIRDATRAEIEVGGGIRDRTTIETLLESGVNYVVIGTKALEDSQFLADSMRDFGPHVILGADARNGFLSTRGWTHDTQIEAVPHIRKLSEEFGVHTVIFTDIARDGMFTSPNFAALSEVCSISGIQVIASGGVGTVEDIRALLALNKPNLTGVIVGKALYDGRVSLREAVELTSVSGV